MIDGRLIHPDILGILAGSGHGAKILIADGNFPHGTHLGPNAQLVYLNLAPGKVLVTEVLEAILSVTPVEAAEVMAPPGEEPSIFEEFQRLLGDEVEIERLDRFMFYEAAASPDACLAVATGDCRLYANILLTIGVVT